MIWGMLLLLWAWDWVEYRRKDVVVVNVDEFDGDESDGDDMLVGV